MSKSLILKNINVTIINISWKAVLYLEILDVTNSKPLLDIIKRRPVINKSLKIIIPTIQNSITPIYAKDINADVTNILSARGSRNLPSGYIF